MSSTVVTTAEPISWLNAVRTQAVPILDRGLAYGDGLFETMRYERGTVPLLPWHLRRLLADAERLYIPLSEAQVITQLNTVLHELQNTASITNTGALKLIVTRGEGGQGYAPPASPQPNCMWIYRPIGDQPEPAQAGVTLCVSPVRLSRSKLLGGIKHLNRLEHVLASQAAKRLPEQRSLLPEQHSLLLDETDAVIETLVHNIFWLHQGALYTPELTHSGVAGVMRQWIIEQAEARGQNVRIERFSLPDVLAADEVFICNSLRGVWPVVQIEQPHTKSHTNATLFKPGPITRQIQKAV
ncbi:MAG: 4-amino-4-deoxychorismate lyase, partial [Pseudomonadota bacterium]